MKRQTILITLLSFFCATLTTIGQTIEELFSIEGLSINAYHWNYYTQDVSLSYTYYQKEMICDTEALVFVNNQTNEFRYISIEDKKVYHYPLYHYNPDLACEKVLLFDFGLEIGETVESGTYAGQILTDKYEITLDNGMTRMRHDLTSSNGAYTVSLIEGIGSTLGGIFPRLGDFEGGDNFVCAKIGDEMLMIGEGQEENCDLYSCITPFTAFEVAPEDLNLTLTNNTLFGDTYLWDFGDGTTSTEANPIHTYNEAGCYEVSLTAYSDCYTEGNTYRKNSPICINNPWEMMTTIEEATSIRVKKSANHLFAYGAQGINIQGTLLKKSDDNGVTWIDISVPLPVSASVTRFVTDIKMYDDDRGIVTCGHYGPYSSEIAIFVTTDGGMTWVEKMPDANFVRFVDIAEDGRAWATGLSYTEYYRSFDYGQNWETVAVEGGVVGEFFTPSAIQYIEGETLVCHSGTNGGLATQRWIGKSTDNGNTWQLTVIPNYINSLHFIDENTAIGFSYIGLHKTTDGGQSWEVLHENIDTYNSYDFIDNETAWVAGDNGLVYYTNDGFETITQSNCGSEKFTSIAGFSDTESFATIGNSLMSFGEAEDTDCTTTNIPTLQQSKINVYPNPITDKVYINNESSSKTQILNIEGKLLIEQTIEQGEQFIETDQLKAGFYILKIETIEDKNTSSFKLIKL